MKIISVVKAEYLNSYKLKITFSDHTVREVDFGSFLSDNPHPQWDKYRNIKLFKKFKIENGNLVWGKDWDLVFPVSNLYAGNLMEPCC